MSFPFFTLFFLLPRAPPSNHSYFFFTTFLILLAFHLKSFLPFNILSLSTLPHTFTPFHSLLPFPPFSLFLVILSIYFSVFPSNFILLPSLIPHLVFFSSSLFFSFILHLSSPSFLHFFPLILWLIVPSCFLLFPSFFLHFSSYSSFIPSSTCFSHLFRSFFLLFPHPSSSSSSSSFTPRADTLRNLWMVPSTTRKLSSTWSQFIFHKDGEK